MSKRSHKFLLEDILESTEKIQRYTHGLEYDTFINDEKTVDAVIRNFEIIGEAANRIDPDYKLSTSHIPWTKWRGLRNRIVHEYFGIDTEIVWAIVSDDIQEFEYQIKTLLKD